MSLFTLAYALLILAGSFRFLKRGYVILRGRFTRTKMTGPAVGYIVVPRIIVSLLAIVVSIADLIGFTPLGQFVEKMLMALIIIHGVTTVVIGGGFQVLSSLTNLQRQKK